MIIFQVLEMRWHIYIGLCVNFFNHSCISVSMGEYAYDLRSPWRPEGIGYPGARVTSVLWICGGSVGT